MHHLLSRLLRSLRVGLAPLAMGVAPSWAGAPPQAPPPATTYSRGYSLLDTLRRPPPSVRYGVETPASRMARYFELGGGAGPVPGYTNGPAMYPYSLPAQGPNFWLPSAGPDPSLSPNARQRVLRRYEASQRPQATQAPRVIAMPSAPPPPHR